MFQRTTASADPTRSRSLHFRLFMLAASGLLPLAILAATGVAYLVHLRQIETQRSAIEVARALGTAVEAELRATHSVLQAIGESAELREERLDALHALASRVAARQGWRSIVVADAQGQLLLSSAQPPGRPTGAPIEPESLARAIATRAPVVGSVAQGPRFAEPAFAVRMPVVVDGQLRHVISAVLPTQVIESVLTRQTVPPGWVVGVFDQTGHRVARTQPHSSARPSPTLQALIDSHPVEAAGNTVTLEGVPSFSGFVRLKDSGWIVALGISRAEVYRPLYPLLGAVALGLLASLAVSGWLARAAGRRVSEPIASLKQAAAALGAGGRVAPKPLGVAELDELGDALGRASVERDRLAEQRQLAEQERDALLVQVTEALRTAQEAARTKDEFLAVLGHELRNPLAPMSNALHLMERKGDERTRREREIIARQLGHMSRLVDDLLDVSRITGKRLTMELKPLRLATLVRHVAEGIRPLLQGRSLQVEIAPDGEDAWVSGDEVRLSQVLSNLLGNSVKFTSPEGSIALALRRVDGAAEIEVRDDGQGMSPEVLERAFDLFFQAPQEADRARGGLGLGLAIVKSLVEMHGGTVTACSDGPGTGCRVTVRLPLADPPAAQPRSEADATASSGGRILVVDDNRDAADTTGALLEAFGYLPRVVYDPQQALAVVGEFAPDLALLDIGLPGMSGYELASRLRAQGFAGKLVALTGYGRESDVAEAHAAGFDAHLTKPVAPQTLLELVAREVSPRGS